MYFPTRSASVLVLARTRLWTLKPVCCQEKLLLHPLAPFLKPLGMTRRAEAAGATGEHQEPLLTTVLPA